MTQRINRLICIGMMSYAALFTQVVAAPRTIQLPPEQAELKPSSLVGYSIAARKCGICHSADYIQYQPPAMTEAQWTAEMQKMQHSYGAPIDADEIKLLGIYLAAVYGDAASVSSSDRRLQAPEVSPTPDAPVTGRKDGSGSSAAIAQSLLTSNGCLACHALKDQVVGPAYQAVAAKYKGDAHALARVEANIRAGGAGKWGPVPMPPFVSLTQEQLRTLAEFVLAQ